jgi:hypothetical protein
MSSKVITYVLIICQGGCAIRKIQEKFQGVAIKENSRAYLNMMYKHHATEVLLTTTK